MGLLEWVTLFIIIGIVVVIISNYCNYSKNKLDVMKSLHEYFEKVDDSDVGEFLINGEWYYAIYGCDSLQMFIDDIIINE